MKNKRGDTSITILVIGVVAICTLAIFSFYFSDKAVKDSFQSVGLVQEAAILKDKISFYENLGFRNEELENILGFGFKTDEKGRYFELGDKNILVKYYIP